MLDRNYAAGLGGVFWQDTRAAFQGVADGKLVQGYLTGLCGGDVTPETIEEALDDLIAEARRGAAGLDGSRGRRGGHGMSTDTASVHTSTPEEVGLPCSEECLLRPGNTNCGGCGMSVGLTLLGRVLAAEERPCHLAIPACCGIVTAGGYPTTSYGVPVVATTFASAPAYATGMARVRSLNDEPHEVICWAGDGGTYDIGIATLSAAAERNENLIYICYDNEIYGNTGGQRSSATPAGARTTTTPGGKAEGKKDIMAIMAAHGIPYAATLSIAHPEDFERKVRTALDTSGTRFLLLHSPCPTGWKAEPGDSIQLVRLAVASGLFPLYEVSDGVRYRINAEPDGTDLAEYFALQKRFAEGEVDLDEARRICEPRVRAPAGARRDPGRPWVSRVGDEPVAESPRWSWPRWFGSPRRHSMVRRLGCRESIVASSARSGLRQSFPAVARPSSTVSAAIVGARGRHCAVASTTRALRDASRTWRWSPSTRRRGEAGGSLRRHGLLSAGHGLLGASRLAVGEGVTAAAHHGQPPAGTRTSTSHGKPAWPGGVR